MAAVVGRPARISTSYVERQNLTVRMQSRRFTRLSNGYSKKLAHHVAAFALHGARYNLCRVHEALRITPAMALNIADHIWTIGELYFWKTIMDTTYNLNGGFKPTMKRFADLDGPDYFPTPRWATFALIDNEK